MARPKQNRILLLFSRVSPDIRCGAGQQLIASDRRAELRRVIRFTQAL
jgi:hypothetical protein